MNQPIRNWTAQRVWIIGASSGIGAALAAALVQRGDLVAVSARRADALAALAAGREEARVRQAVPGVLPGRPAEVEVVDQKRGAPIVGQRENGAVRRDDL